MSCFTSVALAVLNPAVTLASPAGKHPRNQACVRGPSLDSLGDPSGLHPASFLLLNNSNSVSAEWLRHTAQKGLRKASVDGMRVGDTEDLRKQTGTQHRSWATLWGQDGPQTSGFPVAPGHETGRQTCAGRLEICLGNGRNNHVRGISVQLSWKVSPRVK